MDYPGMLRKLIDGNAERAAKLTKLDRAMRREYDSPYLPSKEVSELALEYNALIERSKVPILEMLVAAQVARLKIDGIRLSADSQALDETVWGWLQASHFDGVQRMLFRDAATFGDGYILVSPGGSRPTFTVEHPLNIIPRISQLDPTCLAMAAKVLTDRAWLYLPDVIVALVPAPRSEVGWEVAPDGITPHGAGECPLIRVPNTLDSKGRSDSEIEPVLPIQERVNQTTFDRLMVQRSQTWRQRWATGIEIRRDKEGKPISPFKLGADTLLVNESPDGRFGEFLQAQLDGLLRAIDSDFAQAAMVTRTPPTYLPQATISSVSAEALVALEAAFDAKLDDRKATAGEAVELAVRVGGRMVGFEIPDGAEVVWTDLALRSLAQRTDAAQKQVAMGFPLSVAMQTLGFTDETARRVLAEIESNAVRAATIQADAQARAFGVTAANADATAAA